MTKKQQDPEKNAKLQEENRKLKEQLNHAKNENHKLKTENKTIHAAWRKTEEFLKNVTDGRSVEEIIKDVNGGKGLRKLETACSSCKSTNISISKFSNFRIIVCADCAHKEKVDESKEQEE